MISRVGYLKLFLVSILILLSFSACRVRLIDVVTEIEEEPEIAQVYEPPEQEVTEIYEPEEYEPEEYEPEKYEPEEYHEPDTPTVPDPDPIPDPIEYETIYVQTPEYVQAEISPGEDTAPVATIENVQLEYEPIVVETTGDSPGETTLDNQGEGTLGLIIDRYTGLLNQGLGSLFECQRVYVYFERLEEFHTVNRTFPEHNLIIESGGFNAAARRGNDALIVDTDWVVRRNPVVIIRLVDSGTLGANVTDTSRAVSVRDEIINREGFEGLSAVLHRRVLLISEELMASEEGRLIAKLHIAHVMYPTLFEDVNIADVYSQIAEAGNVSFLNGVFAL